MTKITKNSKSSPKNRTVWDTYKTAYHLTGKLGEGGQGMVCTTERPSVLVKVFNDKDPERRRRWVNRLNWVLRQELDGLRIARPQALIEQPVPGYVMELMDGLHPLQEMLEVSHQALLDGNGLSGYVATGGLKRRVALLRELASTLAGLHARGLAFGDLSPANVFVSNSVEHHQLWLIDCDNLCATERLGHGHIHTPGYGAPEIVRGERGVNSLTDAWSFAVIAFELLTHLHPLKGEAVLDGEQDEEERALRGELPWIHHPENDSNRPTEGGVPLGLVATPRLRKLFEDCFNIGRDDPLVRPSLGEWADALDAAWALTLDCEAEDCHSSFYWNDDRQCPFCDHHQSNGLLLMHAWLSLETPEALYLDTGDQQALGVGRSIELHLAPVGTRTYRDSPLACVLKLDDEGLRITPQSGAELVMVRLEDGKEVLFSETKWLRPDRRRGMALALILAHPDIPGLRPVWRFVW
jgi:DNA-binding helix-hairpin-helix protein with protein kinase domain